MPVFFHSPLEHTKADTLAATAVRGVLLFARRGPKDRLLLSVQQKIHPQQFGVYDELTCEERTDADPAVGTLGEHAYVAWKAHKSDRVTFARVLIEVDGWNSKVVGLADKETLEPPMRGPLALVPNGDRFLLAHTTEDGTFAYASVVPFDQTFTDPLPKDTPGCELCAITHDDEFYLTQNDTWAEVGRFSGKPRVKLSPGWYPLLLTLKEGTPDLYHAGDTSEWQGILGEQVREDELTDEEEPEDAADRQVLRYLAISHPQNVGWYAEALGKITRAKLRKRYDKLAEQMPGRKLSDKEFESAWKALEELVAFLRGVAGKELCVVHRSQLPAEPPPPLPKVGKVKGKAPTAKAAAAPHPDGLGVLAEAANSFGVKPNSPVNEWPFNVLSQKAVRYGDGRIGWAGDELEPDAGADERQRCFAIAAEAEARFARLPIRTIDFGALEACHLVADRGAKPPRQLTPEYVRAAFHGTLHPWAKVEIQTGREFGAEALGGGEVQIYGYRVADVKMHNRIWADTMDWFENHPDLTGKVWYVSVEGGGLHGCMAVRLVVGMTKAGSLVGVWTVGLGSAITRTIEPKDLYKPLLESERKGYDEWRDPATGRVAARVVLRTFDPEPLFAWNEKTQAATKKMKAKDRTAYWLGEFAQLKPVRTLTLSPAWEAIQRCITNGRLADWPEPEAPLFYGSGWDNLGDPNVGFHCFHGDRLLKIVNWLSAHSTRWLHKRYDDLRATDYAAFMSDADKQAVTDAYEAVKEFYLEASEKYAVVVEVTTRPDGVAIAPPPDKAPPKKAKPAKGGNVPADCETTNDMLAPLLPCMETYGVGDDDEWPHNDLSTKLVRYTCGNIAREGEEIPHDHDPAEVERVRTLAAEAEKQLAELDPPHDQGGPYLAFFTAANKGEPVPEVITPEFVRDRLFRGTAHPEGDIRVEPLTGERVWYYDGAKATAFVDWFRAQPGLHGFAYVSVGLSEDIGGACHPRLAVALTDKGSVVGVCGYVVWA